MTETVPFESIVHVKSLGSGSYGSVFLGRINDEEVAVKMFTKEKQKEFEKIEELRKLQHPNIIRFIGVTEGTFGTGILMEYCNKGTVRDVLQHKETKLPMSLFWQIDWAVQIARGMNYLHSQIPPIIHRDLKPANILVNHDGVLKIIDFGEFRRWTNEQSATMTFCGTYAWMAPEMLRNEHCSEKVDVWAYGVVLYEILTGKVPYQGIESYRILHGVASNTMRLEVPDSTPEGLKDLLETCWKQTSKERPSFRGILQHLEKTSKSQEALLSVPPTTSSMGTQFFIAFPYCPYIGGRSIVLSNGNTVSTDVQVMSSFKGFKDVSVVIPPISTHRIDFPKAIEAQRGDNRFTREQKGISVNSKEPLIVTVVRGRYNDDALLAFPSSALGTLYYPITAWKGKDKDEECQVIAVGTEDSKTVTFTVGSEVKKSEINRLDIQTLSLKGKDLTGTRVESNKPIALYTAWNCTDFFYHFAMCASIPVHALGDRFPVASLITEEWDEDCTVYIKIVAAESDTGVFVDGKLKTVIHNQGQSYRYEIPPGSSHLLTTSKPAAVAHETRTGYDVSISNVASDTQFIKGKHLFRTVWNRDPDVQQYIVIITYKGNEDEIEIDGERIRGKWTEIGGSEFSFITVSTLNSGQHSVDCTDPTGLYTATLVEYDQTLPSWFISNRLVGVTLKICDRNCDSP